MVHLRYAKSHTFIRPRTQSDDNRIVDPVESKNGRNWWSQAVENIRINWLCYAPDSLRSRYNVSVLWIAQSQNKTDGLQVTRTFLPSHDVLGCATAALLRFPLLTNGFRRFIWLVRMHCARSAASIGHSNIKWNLPTASHESNAHPIPSNKIEYVRWNYTWITFELHPYADR